MCSCDSVCCGSVTPCVPFQVITSRGLTRPCPPSCRALRQPLLEVRPSHTVLPLSPLETGLRHLITIGYQAGSTGKWPHQGQRRPPSRRATP